MATQAKMSRNRQRKTAYAAQADKGSRNEQAIEAPIVGHFETVEEEVTKISVVDDLGHETIRTKVRKLAKPYQRIVHDEKREVLTASVSNYVDRRPTRNPAARRRRQQVAWERCMWKAKNGEHDYSGQRNKNEAPKDRCITCGCPASEAQ